MLQQLLDDLRGYFESKPSLTETEQALLNRLNSGYFPIASIHRDDLAGKGFDTGHVSDEDMKYLARKMADDYREQLFWSSMEIIASEMANISKFPACPQCLAEHSLYESASRIYQCAECGRTWSNDYVLVEFPDDASYFEENDIGYPSFGSEDNGARYVPEYDYIRHFQKTRPGTPIISRFAGPSPSRTSSRTNRTNRPMRSANLSATEKASPISANRPSGCRSVTSKTDNYENLQRNLHDPLAPECRAGYPSADHRLRRRRSFGPGDRTHPAGFPHEGRRSRVPPVPKVA